MGHSGLRAMVTSQLIWKFLVFQQSTEYRSCTHPSLIHFSPRGVAWSPNIRKSPQAPDQVKDSRYVDEGAKHPVGDESHLGRESQSPEAKESIYSNVHSGCYRWGVRELGFGPKTPTQSLREALRQGRGHGAHPWRAPSPESADLGWHFSLYLFCIWFSTL